MFFGQCCATGLPLRHSLQLDIFIEIPRWDFHEKAHPVKGQRSGLRQLGQRYPTRYVSIRTLFEPIKEARCSLGSVRGGAAI